MENMNQEIWKPVKGYEGYYEVSDLGRVRSVARTITYNVPDRYSPVSREYPSKIRKGTQNKKDGHVYVMLSINEKMKLKHVGRMVAEAFLDVKAGQYVEHLNGDKADNRLTNLAVVDKARRGSSKPVVCNETGEVFWSISDAAARLNMTFYEFSKYLNSGEPINGYTYTKRRTEVS